MNLKLLSVLLVSLISVQGSPTDEYYNDDYNAEYDYDDDLPINDVEDDKVPSHIPKIVSDPVKLDVDNGMTIRLPCVVDKLPDGVQIIWSKMDSMSTTIAIGTRVVSPEFEDRATVSVSESGSTLQIGIAQSEDAGKYKCSVAVRGEQPQLKHDVRIRAPPSVDVSTPSLLEVKKGDDVTLNCRAAGKPAPTVRWSRLGQKMPDGTADIESEVVIFREVTRKHAGTYKCTASNGHGSEASKLVEVVVEYGPEVEVTEMFVHSHAGQDKVELVCTVHAHPAPSVIWEKEGQLISNLDRMKYNNIGSRHTLIIGQVEPEDFGKYFCKATNNLGSQQKVIELSELASTAEFKSQPEGRSETEFLLEWSTLSYTPVKEFKLEVAELGYNSWRSYLVRPSREGGYHWAGKQFLSDLKPATQYRARVTAQNTAGWSQSARQWNFASLGAQPHSDFSASAAGSVRCRLSLLSLLSPLVLLLRWL